MEATGGRPSGGSDFAGIELALCVAVFMSPVALVCLFKWNRERFDRLLTTITGSPMRTIFSTGFEFYGTTERSLAIIMEYIHTYRSEPFKLFIPQYRGVFLTKPEDIQIVLNSSKALEKDQLLYNAFHDLIGDGILIASVDKWRKLRRIAVPPFNSNILKQHNVVFNEKSYLLVEYLKKELGNTQPFDIMKYISNINLNIILQTAAGCNFNDRFDDLVISAEAILKIGELDIMKIFKPWLYPDIIFSIYIKLTGQQGLFEVFDERLAQIFQKRKIQYHAKRIIDNKTNDVEDTDDDKKNRKIFLDKLLDVNDHPDIIFSEKDLKYEILSLLGAGSETSAGTLCFCISLLAIHPDIQNKVYDEIHDVLNDDDEILTLEDTYKLVYMEQVLKETLRLYPSIPLFFRKLDGDVKIVSKNYTLPKGTSCAISPMGIHRIPELYPNPSIFNPENFNAENVARRHKCSWIPFSGGPRGCLGYKYSMISMKVQLTTLLQNYSFHTDWKMSDIKLKFDIVLRSVHGHPVTIRPRDRRPKFKRDMEL